MKETFGKIPTNSKISLTRSLVSEMGLVGHGNFNSSKIYFVLINHSMAHDPLIEYRKKVSKNKGKNF